MAVGNGCDIIQNTFICCGKESLFMPNETYRQLIQGVNQFQESFFQEHQDLYKTLASNQQPHTLFISCIDSRVEPLLVTQCHPGDMFIMRVIGNVVGRPQQRANSKMAAIDYAVEVKKVNNIIICGHSDCGAMRAIEDPDSLTSLPDLSSWVDQLHLDHLEVPRVKRENKSTLEHLTMENVARQLEVVRELPAVKTRLAENAIELHGWYFDIGSGKVKEYDLDQREFLELSEKYAADGTLKKPVPASS
jgi:carbonic anhydrase